MQTAAANQVCANQCEAKIDAWQSKTSSGDATIKNHDDDAIGAHREEDFVRIPPERREDEDEKVTRNGWFQHLRTCTDTY